MIYTSTYPYCKFDFDVFNPLQEECYKYFEEDSNLLISATVAAGKTAIHEAIAGYELSQSENSKVIYTAPMKAICDEKFVEWLNHETFKNYKMSLLSSDNFVDIKELEESRIIVATIESINVCCRRRDKWIKDVKLLTFDEAHLFNNIKRGAGSEALIMNITDQNKDCRILCLSGTLSNIKEIARWIKGLNNKKTFFVNSSWRPTKLNKKIEITENIKEQLQYIIDTINKNPEDKILIFVHSKKIGEYFLNELRRNMIKCHFYSSDLSFDKRKDIIERYKDKYSDFNVLISTNSLSMGINI